MSLMYVLCIICHLWYVICRKSYVIWHILFYLLEINWFINFSHWKHGYWLLNLSNGLNTENFTPFSIHVFMRLWLIDIVLFYNKITELPGGVLKLLGIQVNSSFWQKRKKKSNVSCHIFLENISEPKIQITYLLSFFSGT